MTRLNRIATCALWWDLDQSALVLREGRSVICWRLLEADLEPGDVLTLSAPGQPDAEIKVEPHYTVEARLGY